VLASTSSDSAFVFDSMHCGPSISVGNNGMTASFTSNETWSTVLGSVGFMVGRNHWEIRIDSSPTAYLFVGVASRDVNLSTFLGGDEFGWGYIGDSALYHKRNKLKAYGDHFRQGDTIGVTLDMDLGTLTFTKNGFNLGVAVEVLTGILYPAFAFYNSGQRITLIRHHYSCPGAGINIAGTVDSEGSLLPQSIGEENGSKFANARSLRSLIRSSRLLEQFCIDSTRTVPEPFLTSVFRQYQQWMDEKVRRCLTQSGCEIDLHTSDEYCMQHFGVKVGDRVLISKANSDTLDQDQEGNNENPVPSPVIATIVGVNDEDGKLWRRIEGSMGSWFMSAGEMKSCSDVNAEGHIRIKTLEQDVFDEAPKEQKMDGVPTSPSHAQVAVGTGSSAVKAKRAKNNTSSFTDNNGDMITKMDYTSFREWAMHPMWTAESDGCIIASVNELCERTSRGIKKDAGLPEGLVPGISSGGCSGGVSSEPLGAFGSWC
jgi:hypothetical protein